MCGDVAVGVILGWRGWQNAGGIQSGERLLIRGDNSMKKFVLAVAMAMAAFAVADGAMAAGGDNLGSGRRVHEQSGAAWWRRGVG
jgi:hypothetical protein